VQAALALYVRRIVREIGALCAVLGGLGAAGLEQVRDLQRQFHIEGIAGGARTQQHPALAVASAINAPLPISNCTAPLCGWLF